MWNFWTRNTQNLHSPGVPIIFPQMQKSFLSDSSKRVYPVSLRMLSKSAQRKHAKHKKVSFDKISKRSLAVIHVDNNLEANNRHFVVRKRLAAKKVITPYVISLLSWYGAVCSRACFCVQQQEIEYSVSYRAEISEVSSWAKSRVPNWLAEKEVKIIFFLRADSLVNKVWSCPRIKLSKPQTLKLEGVETRVLLSDFSQQLRRKNADVHDIYFTQLDAAGKNFILVLIKKAEKQKEGGCWVPSKNWTAEAAQIVNSSCCYFYILAQFIKG